MSRASAPVLIKACLNGGRSVNEHPAVPVSPDELARDARRAVAAGAAALHVHARRPDGSETLEPGPCAAALRAIRTSSPGVPIGLTTAASAEADPGRRLALVGNWDIIPDFVSVNFSEPGSVDLCALLLEKGIGIEAGLWSPSDVETFVRSGFAAQHCLRVLVEPQEPDPLQAVATAHAIDQLLTEAGILLPQVHHGEGLATWAVLEAALAGGHDIRIGLEDTTQRPDGLPARDNAELVTLAVEMARRHGRQPLSIGKIPYSSG